MLEIGLQERVIISDRHAIGIAIRADHVGMRQETAAAKAWRRSEASLRLGVTFLQQAHEIGGTQRLLWRRALGEVGLCFKRAGGGRRDSKPRRRAGIGLADHIAQIGF